MNIGEVWYAQFPLEEDPTSYIERPVIIADIRLPKLLVIKVTTSEPRKHYPFDTPIAFPRHAKLPKQSTARISKINVLDETQLLNQKGTLHPLDDKNIFDFLYTFSNYCK